MKHTRAHAPPVPMAVWRPSGRQPFHRTPPDPEDVRTLTPLPAGGAPADSYAVFVLKPQPGPSAVRACWHAVGNTAWGRMSAACGSAGFRRPGHRGRHRQAGTVGVLAGFSRRRTSRHRPPMSRAVPSCRTSADRSPCTRRWQCPPRGSRRCPPPHGPGRSPSQPG